MSSRARKWRRARVRTSANAITTTSDPALTLVGDIEVTAPVTGSGEVLSPEALAFVAELHRRFEGRRRRLLADRTERQARLDRGELPDFLPETREVRES